jgi:hypothetical protein
MILHKTVVTNLYWLSLQWILHSALPSTVFCRLSVIFAEGKNLAGNDTIVETWNIFVLFWKSYSIRWVISGEHCIYTAIKAVKFENIYSYFTEYLTHKYCRVNISSTLCADKIYLGEISTFQWKCANIYMYTMKKFLHIQYSLQFMTLHPITSKFPFL